MWAFDDGFTKRLREHHELLATLLSREDAIREYHRRLEGAVDECRRLEGGSA